MKLSYLSLLFLVLSCVMQSQAQAEAGGWVEKNIWPESPTASTIREVTTPQPALLTGAASFSIPIHTLVAEDLSIPLTFSYHSNGNKITDDPCPWGYGWALTPSIRLTRRILGRPDGLFKSVNDYHPGQYLNHNQAYHCMVDSMVGVDVMMHSDFYLDASPDIFTVQLADTRFSFLYINGNAVTAGHDEYSIIADDLLQNFTITDPSGYVYNFDIQGERCFSNQNLTEWLPSSITCPSGRKLSFSYISCESSVKNRQKHAPKVYSWKSYGSPQTVTEGNVLFTHPDFWGCRHLSSISFAGESINVAYEGTDGKRNLSEITVKCHDVTARSFRFTYSDNLPTIISTPEGDYNMEYDPHTFHEGSGHDWWGYPNGNPQYKWDVLGAPRIEIQPPGLYTKIIHQGSNRNINEEYMQAKMLRKVIYPTGGSVEWEYETHRFPPVSYMSGGISYISNPVTLDKGGGLRVSGIILRNGSDDTNPRVTRYVYGEDGNGLANCVCAPTLDTFVELKDIVNVDLPLKSMNEADFFSVFSNMQIYQDSRYMDNMIGIIPIWYSQIEEIHPEGKIVYKYEDICDEDDFMECDGFTRLPLMISHAFSDGPVLTEVSVYSQTGNSYTKVKSEIMDYDVVTGSSCYGYSIFRLLNCTDMATNNSWPDFSGTLSVYIELPMGAGFKGGYYRYSENSIYSAPLLTINPVREELVGKKTTEYLSNGNRTVTQAFTYIEGTSLVESAVISTPAESITQTYRYPVPESTVAVERAMAARGILGIVTEKRVSYGSHSVTTRANMKQYGTVFRPVTVTTKRDDGAAVPDATYVWNNHGVLLSRTDRAGIKTSYTWDSNSRYPLTMTTGDQATKAVWKYGVGVTSLTAPDGVKSVYSYDSKGRLASEGVDGYGTLKKWSYNISQSGGNYVREYTLRTSDDTNPPYVQTNYDFLGRPVTQVTAIRNNSSAWEYAATATEYDRMGRAYRSYPASPVTGAGVTAAEVASAASGWYGQTYPYSLTEYEPSPRKLTVSTMKAGDAWHTASKKVTVRRYTNSLGNNRCTRLAVSSSGGIESKGFYPAGSLRITETVDEDGIKTVTSVNLRGQTIQERHGDATTYYVYDDFGDLRYILPPGLTAKAYAADDAGLEALGYYYTYDAQGRLVKSRRPGGGESRYLYDSADRVVAGTTPDLGGRWRMHYYDGLGREVLTVETATDPATLPNIGRAWTTELAAAASGSLAGYSPSVVPDDAEVFTAYYYDSYDYLKLLDDAPFRTVNPQGTDMKQPTGHLTGIYTGKGCEVIEYDAVGREVRRTGTGFGDGVTDYTYGFCGEILTEQHTFPARYNLPDRTMTTTYDNAGRPVSRQISLGTSSALFNWTYDRTGRAKSSSHGSSTRTYAFDIHGWPTKITTAYLPATGQWKTLTETVQYADGATPRYDGFISSHTVDGGKYDFIYDGNGRLTDADFTPSSGTADFSTSYTYDGRGNILTVKRYGVTDRTPAGAETFGLLDDLSATYTGNMLTTVTSDIPSVSTFAGRSGASLRQGDYSLRWDAAGRLTYDASRSLVQMQYNTSGLMTSARKSWGDLQSYTYDNLGRKMSAEYLTVRTGITQRRDYFASGLVVYNDSVEMIRFPGGYFDSALQPHYYATDYQGNNVMVLDNSGRMEQSYTYYPYGEPVRRPTATFGDETNRHLYGDKEYMNSFGEATYDQEARAYSPSVIPFFTTQDPKASDYSSVSPYSYCASNPIVFIDPTGERIEGVSKDDADYLVEDFQSIFTGDEFKEFRKLIVRDGKKHNKRNLAPISPEARAAAFEGVTLNEDQTALVDMFVNAVNSEESLKATFVENNGNMPKSVESPFVEAYSIMWAEQGADFSIVIEANGGVPIQIAMSSGIDGVTTNFGKGSVSLIYKTSILNGVPRAVITGHEVLGHGRSLSLRRGKLNQNKDAIQTDNLIRRVMGITSFRDGSDHKGGIVNNPYDLPDFR